MPDQQPNRGKQDQQKYNDVRFPDAWREESVWLRHESSVPTLCRVIKPSSNSRAVAFDCAVRVAALKALLFATPAVRAAIGLDRGSREPRIAIIDGPPKGS